ncbi:MAG: hypothetical protein H7Z42_07690 [Roseiflexaceae bacterium]|nr:hypothetical protein [Roseiflexaceae bacterium]
MDKRLRQLPVLPAWVTYALLGMIIVSLLLHLLTWVGITQIRALARAEVLTLAEKMDAAQVATFSADFPIVQQVPIRATVPISKSLIVPISTNVSINDSVTVPIGGLNFAVPIIADVPIDTSVPIVFRETIEISTTVALDMIVPIRIPIEDTSLAEYLDTLETQLRELAENL